MPSTAEERLARISLAARRIFIEKGLEGARIADIASAAGVTETALYRHFRSKEELFEEAVLGPLGTLAQDLVTLAPDFRHISAQRRFQLSARVHEKLAVLMAEISPLIGVALFSNHATGSLFYNQRLTPIFDDVVATLTDVMPRGAREVIDPRLFFLAMFGMHLTVSLYNESRGTEMDVQKAADDMTALIAFGAFGASSTD